MPTSPSGHTSRMTGSRSSAESDPASRPANEAAPWIHRGAGRGRVFGGDPGSGSRGSGSDPRSRLPLRSQHRLLPWLAHGVLRWVVGHLVASADAPAAGHNTANSGQPDLSFEHQRREGVARRGSHPARCADRGIAGTPRRPSPRCARRSPVPRDGARSCSHPQGHPPLLPGTARAGVAWPGGGVSTCPTFRIFVRNTVTPMSLRQHKVGGRRFM